MSREFMASSPIALRDVERFEGTGIYALFYRGEFPAYRQLADNEADWPIYVGKAAPSTRKGDLASGAPLGAYGNTFLYGRIRNHVQSVEAASNLDVADFSVRLLVLSYIWVPLAESSMIARYRPVWNSVVDGFGNHDPGKGRINGVRSRWDTLHPGRHWAAKYPARSETARDIEQEVVQALRTAMW